VALATLRMAVAIMFNSAAVSTLRIVPCLITAFLKSDVR
jgi:hypothetical protein